MEELFGAWLQSNKNISQSSIEKYKRAIRAVSKDMNKEGLIDFDLYSITSDAKFYSLKKVIFDNESFDKKDTRGNRMYSVALNHYYDFLCSR
jgi:site-specific recombinase XerD